MKIVASILFLALLLLVGGFLFFAFTDPAVQQTEIVKEITPPA